MYIYFAFDPPRRFLFHLIKLLFVSSFLLCCGRSGPRPAGPEPVGRERYASAVPWGLDFMLPVESLSEAWTDAFRTQRVTVIRSCWGMDERWVSGTAENKAALSLSRKLEDRVRHTARPPDNLKVPSLAPGSRV